MPQAADPERTLANENQLLSEILDMAAGMPPGATWFVLSEGTFDLGTGPKAQFLNLGSEVQVLSGTPNKSDSYWD
jgi:hypothetical protein